MNTQEALEQAPHRYALKTTEVTGKFLLWACKKIVQHYKEKDFKIKGKQSVKQLLTKEQSVSRMPIHDTGIKDFQKSAKKYGLDFSIVKDHGNSPQYTIFFKSKDIEVYQHIVEDLTKKQMQKKNINKGEKILDKLQKARKNIISTNKQKKIVLDKVISKNLSTLEKLL